jgi:excinuclease ABC subunit B
MQRAIDETNRRRELQQAHNKAHGIKPVSVFKSVEQVRLSTRVADARVDGEAARVREESPGYAAGEDVEAAIARVETEMRKAAADLDFESAARLRDQLFELKAAKSGSRASPGTGGRWREFSRRSPR